MSRLAHGPLLAGTNANAVDTRRTHTVARTPRELQTGVASALQPYHDSAGVKAFAQVPCTPAGVRGTAPANRHRAA